MGKGSRRRLGLHLGRPALHGGPILSGCDLLGGGRLLICTTLACQCPQLDVLCRQRHDRKVAWSPVLFQPVSDGLVESQGYCPRSSTGKQSAPICSPTRTIT